MATRHVAALQRGNPTRLICWIERAEPGERDLYLGEDHADHTVRIGAYRVTADGHTWVNIDPTLLADRWARIE